MKILVVSYAFSPSVGGLERVAETLNAGLLARGHEIQVITNYIGDTEHPYPIWRRPEWAKQRELAQWCDAVLMHNMSITYARLVLSGRRPLVCVSHGDYGFVESNFRGRLLRWLIRRVDNVAVSDYVASRLPKAATVIRNPIGPAPRDEPRSIVDRPKDILFVGRLVRGKGVHVLLSAIRDWPGGPKPAVTIVGDGQDSEAIRALAAESMLDSVRFTGALSAEDVAREMAIHRLLAVPSVDTEGLGLVALEGLDAGAIPVASSIGGLPEVAGECGFLLPPGDSVAWTRELPRILAGTDDLQAKQDRAPAFLEPFRLEAVLDRYEETLGQAVARKR